MTDITRLILLPAIVAGAWFISGWRPEAARKTARLLAVLLGIFLVVLAFTGFLRTTEAAAITHKWSGHLMFIAAWLSVPFAIGVSLEQHARQRLIAAIAHGLSLLVILAAILLASWTGYLGPTDANNFAEETRNRFNVLHLVVLPGITAMLLLAWFWFLRPRQPAARSDDSE